MPGPYTVGPPQKAATSFRILQNFSPQLPKGDMIDFSCDPQTLPNIHWYFSVQFSPLFSRLWSVTWSQRRNSGPLASEQALGLTHSFFLLLFLAYLISSFQTDSWGRWRRIWGGGINGDESLDLGWWTHNTVYWWYVVELCTWSLYKCVNQCHPKKYNKKEKRQKRKLTIKFKVIFKHLIHI